MRRHRIDPSKDMNSEILLAAGRKPAGAAEPPAPSEVPGVDNGAGAAAPARAPLTMNDVILAAAGRGPRW